MALLKSVKSYNSAPGLNYHFLADSFMAALSSKRVMQTFLIDDKFIISRLLLSLYILERCFFQTLMADHGVCPYEIWCPPKASTTHRVINQVRLPPTVTRT